MSERICAVCGKSLLRDEVGLSLKLYGTGSQKLFCLTCLANKLHCEEEKLKDMIEYLKKTGCALFN